MILHALDVAGDAQGLVRLFEILDLIIGQLHGERAYPAPHISVRFTAAVTWQRGVPMISSRFFKFVDPTMGAETPSLESIQAIDTCAMLTLFFFASSSTLNNRESTA